MGRWGGLCSDGRSWVQSPVILCAVKLQFTSIERVTKDVSAESSAATDVIPLVIGIKCALDKRHWAADNEKRNNWWHEHQVRRHSSATTLRGCYTCWSYVSWQTFQSVRVCDCQAVASGRSWRCALPDPVTEGATTEYSVSSIDVMAGIVLTLEWAKCT